MQDRVIEGFPLSLQQKRLWRLDHTDEHSPYRSWGSLLIEGPYDHQALQAALMQVLDRQEILRTTFPCVSGLLMPLQTISERGDFSVHEHDIRHLDAQDQAQAAEQLIADFNRQPLDLANGPLVRFALLRLAADRRMLFIGLPSICADMASLMNLVRELAAYYEHGPQAMQVSDEPLQYADIAAWEHELLMSEETAAGKSYWQEQLSAGVWNERLPYARPSGDAGVFTPSVFTTAVQADAARTLQALARATSISDWLLTCWQTLLLRLVQRSDLLVGVAYSGRSYAELIGAIGPYTRYLPIALKLDELAPFSRCLAQVQEATRMAGTWQDCYDWQGVGPSEATSEATPFFSFCFEFQDFPTTYRAGETTFSLHRRYSCTDRFELKLVCVLHDGALTAEFHYDAAVYAPADIQRLAEEFCALLENVAGDPGMAISAYDLVGPNERQQILVGFNAGATAAADGASIHELFAAQVARAPHQVALVYEDQHVTYASLNARATQLSGYLRAHSVGPEVVVAICAERAPELIMGVLGVLKAGGAYVPLDPAQPPEYQSAILAQTRAPLLITANDARGSAALVLRSSFIDLHVVDLRADWPAIAGLPADLREVAVDPANLAYVIFTSGSTGAPKGVAVAHGQLRNYIGAILARLDPPAGAAFAMVSTIAADLGNTMIFPALCGDGSLHLIAAERASHSKQLAAYMRSRQIDYLKIVPSHLAALLSAANPADVLPRRRLALGGEAASWDLVARIEQLAPGCGIVNHYGPTETTVGVLAAQHNPLQRDPRVATLPLGRPLAGTQIYVLDAYMRPAPIWTPGELYIAGSQLARGYLGRPDLTAERFIPNPFATTTTAVETQDSASLSPHIASLPHTRLYKTGDLARWLPDGTLEFLGRIDDQLKLRGFRIEPVGIAAAIRQHPAVQDAVVVARATEHNHTQLVAYVVADRRHAPSADGHERYRLPNNMAIAQLNAYETDFFYQQIFVGRTELRHGVTLPRAAVVFDVGANIGLFTLFVQQVRPDATIYAFEPAPPVFAALRTNADLYGARVKLFMCGLSDAPRTARFTYYPQSSCQSGYYGDVAQDMQTLRVIMLNQQTGARDAQLAEYVDELVAERARHEYFTCHLRTLSEIIAEQGVEQIDLLKIDVEKSEYDILAGIDAGDWPKIRQIVIEAHDIDGHVQAITDLLNRQGYRVVAEQSAFIKDTDLYNIYAIRPGEQAQNGALGSDLLALPLPQLDEPFLALDELQGFLKARLPDYMVPSTFVLLDALPLTPNGKLDRKALPLPDGVAKRGVFTAPRTPNEELLAEIWMQTLDQEGIGIDDNFFALGGDSIRAIRILSLAQEHGLRFTLPQLLQHQTIRELVATLKGAEEHAITPVERVPFGLTSQADRLKIPTGIVDAYPLTMLQAGMIFHSEYNPESAVYHDIHSFHLRARLNLSLLQEAIQYVVDRHPALRTSFDLNRFDEPLQLVHAAVTLPVHLDHLEHLDSQAQEAAIADWMEEDLRHPFDWTQPALLRFQVHQRSEETFQFTMSFHHAILDGWSAASLLTELFHHYLSLLEGQGLPAEQPLAALFRDFVALEQETLRSAPSRRYWNQQLEDCAASRLPRWFSKGSRDVAARVADVDILIPDEVSDGLKRLSRQLAAPLKSVLLAAHLRVMSFLGGTPDVLTGLSLNGRPETIDGERVLGLFLNNPPLRMKLDGGSWRDLAQATFRAERDLYPFRRYPLAELQKQHGGQPLFDVAFNFTHYHVYQSLLGLEALEALGWSGYEETNFALVANFTLDPVRSHVRLILSYQQLELDDAQVKAIGGYFVRALTAMVRNPGGRYERVGLLGDRERQQLLIEWNSTAAAYPDDRCLHQLIEAQSARHPDAVALVFHASGEGSAAATQSLTFAELNRRSNQLAHYLRKHGVGPEVRVGICMERSPALVIGLLGVLKAGGAYVPLDPAYPPDRLAFILADAQAAILISQQRLAMLIPAQATPTIYLEAAWNVIAAARDSLPASTVGPDNVAYMIYTSGSTGRPKGVMISHRGLANYLSWATNAYAVAQGRGAPVHSSIGFDLTITSLFTPLLAGAPVTLLAEGQGVDALTTALLDADLFSLVKLTPTHLEALNKLMPTDALAGRVRSVIIGGEALLAEDLSFWRTHAPDTQLINEYGPTETVVGCCVYRASAGAPWSGPVPIGRPIANVQLYVLDPQLNPAPVGALGELYIGGVGVARGYHNRPELTAAAFVPNPLHHESGVRGQKSEVRRRRTKDKSHAADRRPPTADCRLYKTGDLVRYEPDGTLVFQGRIDDQVKIRGYRIELGEIEAVLEQHSGVQQAIVGVKERGAGERRLVAYLVLTAEAGAREQRPDEAPFSELRTFLAERLPGYMLPSAFVLLDALPLTSNGKIDRRALDAYDGEHTAADAPFVASRTSIEQQIAELWRQLLGVKQVGIHDNFFALGGDSILNLQFVARARRAGIEVTPRQLFEHPTIAELASLVGTAQTVQHDQGAVSGSAPLTPIQRWFFAQDLPDPHHFNQAVLLKPRQPLDIAQLQRAVEQLLVHHDALRLRFIPEPTGWRQVHAAGTQHGCVAIDLSALPAEQHGAAIETVSAELQTRLNVTTGPLIQVALFKRGSGRSDRLLIIIHHLVTDGISWRVLLEDLQTCYEQLMQGEQVTLPPKTTSFKQWASWLSEFAQSRMVRQDLDYWLALSQKQVARLPVDQVGVANTERSAATVTTALSIEATQALLYEVSQAYQAQLNDVLLAPLAQALISWTGERTLMVDMEGHGREDLSDTIDLSRTVGWFTSIFPVLLDLKTADDPGAMLMTVKEQLRSIPGRGFSYGLLRYLADDTSLAERLEQQPSAEVLFNYLGRIERGLPNVLLFASADEPIGPLRSPSAPRQHVLEINASVVGDQLRLEWNYNEEMHRRATIERLAERYTEALHELIAHCQSHASGGVAPSDFPLANLDEQKLSVLAGLLDKLDPTKHA